MRLLFLLLANTLIINAYDIYSVKIEKTVPPGSTELRSCIIATRENAYWGALRHTEIIKDMRTHQTWACASIKLNLPGLTPTTTLLAPKKSDIDLLETKIAEFESKLRAKYWKNRYKMTLGLKN